MVPPSRLAGRDCLLVAFVPARALGSTQHAGLAPYVEPAVLALLSVAIHIVGAPEWRIGRWLTGTASSTGSQPHWAPRAPTVG
jgi:hypothetical protein